MPSNAYFAELNPDPFLRRCVAWSGIVLVIAGIAAIDTLPLSRIARMAAALTWCLVCAWELWRIRAAWADCRALRVFGDGEIRVRGRGGEWVRARLLPGSLLLRRWAWIRIRREDGPVFAELLQGSCRIRHDWRRLQVIWRHVGDWE